MEFERRKQLEALEARIGYCFSDKGLLNTALTHASYVKGDGRGCAHNERLEFLGDAVLELSVSLYLYHNYPAMNEGHMTRARASTVYEQALYHAAQEMHIGETLLLSRGEEHSGGRKKSSILADALEALIGAVYLDGGWDAANSFVLRFSHRAIEEAARSAYIKDYKTLLQEHIQRQHKGNVTYRLASESGPDHKKVFIMQCFLEDQLLGEGSGGSKQEAGQMAAHAALLHMGVIEG